MFKLVAFFAVLAVAAANPGFLAAPAYGAYAPYAAPVATSYANTYKVAVKAPVVAAPAYPYAAPYSAYGYAAPAVVKAPLAYGAYPYAAPVAAAYLH